MFKIYFINNNIININDSKSSYLLNQMCNNIIVLIITFLLFEYMFNLYYNSSVIFSFLIYLINKTEKMFKFLTEDFFLLTFC